MNPQNHASVLASMILGASSFALVSLAGFGVWAFAGDWFHHHIGEIGLYLASAAVFVLLAGAFMHPLLAGDRKMSRFYKAFVPAFLAYAFAWSVCWFVLRFGRGEWVGSFIGCVLFTRVLSIRLGARKHFNRTVIVLFLAHSAGYFAGSKLYSSRELLQALSSLPGPQVMLIRRMLWGLLYGLGFGAGMGYAFHALQRPGANSQPHETPPKIRSSAEP